MWHPLKKSAMHHVHESLEAEFVEQHGWLIPERYKSVETEIESLRTTVGIGDHSFRGKLSLQGRNLEKILSSIFSDIAMIRLGKAVQTGTLESKTSCLLCPLTPDETMILTKPTDADKAEQDVLSQIKKSSTCVHLTNVTSSHAGITLVGPLSPQVLKKMTEVDVNLKTFTNMSCAQGGVAKIPTIILRNDLGTLPAFELYFSRDLGEYVWEAIVQDGEEFRITPFGLSAREKAESW